MGGRSESASIQSGPAGSQPILIGQLSKLGGRPSDGACDVVVHVLVQYPSVAKVGPKVITRALELSSRHSKTALGDETGPHYVRVPGNPDRLTSDLTPESRPAV